MSDTATHTHDQAGGEPPLMAHGSVLQTGIANGKIGMWLFLGSEVMFFTGLIGAYIILRFGQDTWANPLAEDYPLNIPLTAANTFLLICSSVTFVWGLQGYQGGNKRQGNLGLLLTTLFGAIFVGVQAYEYYELWYQTDPVEEIHAYIEHEANPTEQVLLTPVAVEMDTYFTKAWSTMAGPGGGGTPGERWSSGKNPTNLDVFNQFLVQPRDPEQQKALEKFAEHVMEHWHHPTRPHSDIFSSCFYAMTGFHGTHVALGVLTLIVLTVLGYMGKWDEKHYAVVENAGLYWHFVDLVWIILFAIVYLM